MSELCGWTIGRLGVKAALAGVSNRFEKTQGEELASLNDDFAVQVRPMGTGTGLEGWFLPMILGSNRSFAGSQTTRGRPRLVSDQSPDTLDVTSMLVLSAWRIREEPGLFLMEDG